MSLHNKPQYNTEYIVDGLKEAGLPHDRPSQLADAFRIGWVAALDQVKKQDAEYMDHEHDQSDQTR